MNESGHLLKKCLGVRVVQFSEVLRCYKNKGSGSQDSGRDVALWKTHPHRMKPKLELPMSALHFWHVKLG